MENWKPQCFPLCYCELSDCVLLKVLSDLLNNLPVHVRIMYALYRIRTTPHQDNSPPYRFWPWWVVLFRGSGPSGALSWWGILLGIVVPVGLGNGWALFLSGGELSLVGSCPRTALYCTLTMIWLVLLLVLNLEIGRIFSDFEKYKC